MAEGYVDTNGVRLWHEELGRPDGAPVVLVMGVDGSAIWWPPELVDGLAGAGYRVVLFDNRDIGLSSHIDYASAPYGLEDMATDTVGLLDALGIDSAHLVGVSMGGMISQLAALRHSDRLHRRRPSTTSRPFGSRPSSSTAPRTRSSPTTTPKS